MVLHPLLRIELIPERLQLHFILHLHLTSLEHTLLTNSTNLTTQDLTELFYADPTE